MPWDALRQTTPAIRQNGMLKNIPEEGNCKPFLYCGPNYTQMPVKLSEAKCDPRDISYSPTGS